MATQRLGLLPPHDSLLRAIAAPIPPDEILHDETQAIIESLLSLAYGEQEDRQKPVLVGLAAPQAGISRRIILVDTGADGHGGVANLQVFINPEIINFSKEKEEWYEGCFSTDRVCGIVERAKDITVTSYSRKGKKIDHEYTGYTARIFQHEIDHLQGIEFVTHITDDRKLHWVEDDEFPLYRDKEAWRDWPNKCSRETWEKIKYRR